MDGKEIERRLAAQDRLLHAILAALAPASDEGSGFDDLISTLSDLTVAVADVTEAVRALRWHGCAACPTSGVPRSGDG